MADSTNIGVEVDERDGMVVNWSDLTEEDHLVIAEVSSRGRSRKRRRSPLMTSPVLLLLFLMRFSMILAGVRLRGFCSGGCRGIDDAYSWS